MDDIERVDCFERLHRFLLQEEPDLQHRIDAQRSLDLSSYDLAYFQSSLVALLSGIDDETAEGKRNIRRIIANLDALSEEPSTVSHVMLHEQGGKWKKPLSSRQTNAVRKSLGNLRDLSSDPMETGTQLDKQLRGLEHLPARVEYLHKLLPCLSGFSLFSYLSRIGYPTIVPDSACQTFFLRLGLLGKTDSSIDVQLKVCAIGQSIASSLNRSPTEVNFWIRAFAGVLSDCSKDVSLCRRSPSCDNCPLQSYCQYFRFQRPRRQRDEALPIKEWRASERPRERLIQQGAGALEDTELLAIILRTGSGDMNVLELARKLRERFNGLHGLEEATLDELKSVRGIGESKAVELKAVFELGRRLIYHPLQPGDVFSSSDEVFRGYSARFSCVKQEEFILLMLDAKNRVIREETISRGGLSSSVVHPREVFKAAIRASAASVLFIHNHPSGDPTPSRDDRVVTQKLEEAAQFLQIRVLDHIIIGRNAYFSFTDDQLYRVDHP